MLIKRLKHPLLTLLIPALTLSLTGCAGGGFLPSFGSSPVDVSNNIKLNQLGFLVASQKLAVVPLTEARQFSIINIDTEQEVLLGTLTPSSHWQPSGETVHIADFSALKNPGNYILRVKGLKDSDTFSIGQDNYSAVNAGAIKAYYFNRVSTPLLTEHAGIYARAAGHPDTTVFIHNSAASQKRPEGTVISSPKGWYDAGDYNKYIVNSGISTYTLLAAYEHFPDHYRNMELNIPESGNGVPDLLDEIHWNLTWMLTMQDPNDGGVYHKLTNKRFDGSIMPDEAITPRYVVQKGTSAALNFAAVMAAASRVYKDYEQQFPGLSTQMLQAAERAWAWAKQNPNVAYDQPADIFTGGYGDKNFSDEFFWAATELFVSTGNKQYMAEFNLAEQPVKVSSWANVEGLPWITLGHFVKTLAAPDQAIVNRKVTELANNLLAVSQTAGYRIAMQDADFVWGSNGQAMNQGMMLIQGYRLTNNRDYLNAAQSILDYSLGRNPLDTSFVTGFGTRTPQGIHHRPSEADGIKESVPGFISGGPQAGQQDKDDCPVAYPSDLPAKSWLDHTCSYASNEVAINWNAPFVYVSGAIQALTE